MEKINFFVNDKAVVCSEDESDMTLLDFLQEKMNLTGTKFSCGIGVCKACTICISDSKNGKTTAQQSCILQVGSIKNKYVYTVESLSHGHDISELQKHFLEKFSFQCGYCTSGFLMATKSMLEYIQQNKIKKSQLDQLIMDRLGSHICRCTGYNKYYEAIKEVSAKYTVE